jgi:nucleoside recognition membrane protein YjiH
MLSTWNWELTLGIILGAIYAVTGCLAAALVGYHFLRLCGVSNQQRQAAFWSVVGFGVPAAIASFVWGYYIGAGLVQP